MIFRIEREAFIAAQHAGPILDARAPTEFMAGHIPGAVSFPIFSDPERERIGTLYKHSGHDRAVLEGLEFFGPRMVTVVKEAQKKFPGRKVRLHCYRGGLRSGTMAWLLELGGFEVTVLDKGYKAWRHLALELFERPWQLMVLGGKTGSGKTLLLEHLREAGEQVIDLEALANHKGSSFGGIGQQQQPTIEQFENNLAYALLQLDPSRRIWVEDESHTIGRAVVPKALFRQMQQAPVIAVDMPLANRISRLTAEYCATQPVVLLDAVTRIKKRLGGLATKQALEAIAEGRMSEMVTLVLAYYDKAYQYQLDARQPGQLLPLPLDAPSADAVAPLMAAAEKAAQQWAASQAQPGPTTNNQQPTINK